MKKIISLILICSMLLALLTGCSYFDKINDGGNEKSQNNEGQNQDAEKKYTGGISYDSHFHSEYGLYWLETYEEVLEAIELLKSHDSTLKRSIGFDCEGDMLDVKWCFKYKWSKAEPLEEGKNFFDRKIEDGEFLWYAFYLDVTIDELLYSEISDYDCMELFYDIQYECYRDFPTPYDTSDLSFNWIGKDLYEGCEVPQFGRYIIEYKGEEWALIDNSNYDRVLPREYFDEFLGTVVIIE